jgi:hypothetical protein
MGSSAIDDMEESAGSSKKDGTVMRSDGKEQFEFLIRNIPKLFLVPQFPSKSQVP